MRPRAIPLPPALPPALGACAGSRRAAPACEPFTARTPPAEAALTACPAASDTAAPPTLVRGT